MSPRLVTLIVLLVLSLGLGVGLGELFFRLYIKIVPPVVLGDFNRGASRVAHFTYGLGAGVLMFLWALVGMFSGRIMRSFSKSAEKI
jgi:hypothetical protein